MVKEHPIHYSEAMIKAKLQGIKTVTRRPIKPQPDSLDDLKVRSAIQGAGYVSKYGKTGDRLYTKENFIITYYSDFERAVKIEYEASGLNKWVQLNEGEWNQFKQWKKPLGKKSKLFMFKSLSRFWDEITGIDAERLHDISDNDLKNEGTKAWYEQLEERAVLFPGVFGYVPKAAFMTLWDEFYDETEYAWENNPWVWVIRFKPVAINHRAVNKNGIAV